MVAGSRPAAPISWPIPLIAVVLWVLWRAGLCRSVCCLWAGWRCITVTITISIIKEYPCLCVPTRMNCCSSKSSWKLSLNLQEDCFTPWLSPPRASPPFPRLFCRRTHDKLCKAAASKEPAQGTPKATSAQGSPLSGTFPSSSCGLPYRLRGAVILSWQTSAISVASKPLSSLSCGHPLLPVHERAALSYALLPWPSPQGEAPLQRSCMLCLAACRYGVLSFIWVFMFLIPPNAFSCSVTTCHNLPWK